MATMWISPLPGVGIWTTGVDNTLSYSSGTSFAVPYVTAAVAGLLSGGAPSDVDRITLALAEGAVDLGAAGKDPIFGWGLVRATAPCRSSTALAP